MGLSLTFVFLLLLFAGYIY
uniref:Uncharacterized protein n=1 Tax=Rhizophora mucronata TaxID=61149 RepID=A0A2P2QZV5_RHIMU